MTSMFVLFVCSVLYLVGLDAHYVPPSSYFWKQTDSCEQGERFGGMESRIFWNQSDRVTEETSFNTKQEPTTLFGQGFSRLQGVSDWLSVMWKSTESGTAAFCKATDSEGKFIGSKGLCQFQAFSDWLTGYWNHSEPETIEKCMDVAKEKNEGVSLMPKFSFQSLMSNWQCS